MGTFNSTVKLMKFNFHKKLFNGVRISRHTSEINTYPPYIYIVIDRRKFLSLISKVIVTKLKLPI